MLPAMPGADVHAGRALKGKPAVKTFLEKDTETAQYVVYDPESKEGVIIDSVLNFNPIASTITHHSADEILAFVHAEGIKVTKIMESHMHADHMTAAQYLKEKLGGVPQVCIGENIKVVQEVFKPVFHMTEPSPEDFDHLFTDGETYNLGAIECEALATPGHTPACMTHRIGDAVFAGDTIFMPDVGSARCDFPKGSAATLFHSIQKIFALPADSRLFVGHDYPPQGRTHHFETTVREEAASNKQINATTELDAFVAWREARDRTLQLPRLIFQSLQVNMRAGRLPREKDGSVILKIPVTVKI